jgi:hypothetical protein
MVKITELPTGRKVLLGKMIIVELLTKLSASYNIKFVITAVNTSPLLVPVDSTSHPLATFL